MKKINLMLYLGLMTFCSNAALAQTVAQTPQHSGYGGVIYVGSGYSNDAEQIAPIDCFTTIALPPQDIQTISKLSEAKSYTDLQNELHVNVSASGGIGQFSADAEANYMHDVEDKDYSLSLNYYEYSTGTISLQPDIDPLNDNGKKNYQDNYNYFGLYCGDKYVSAYQEGVMLVMALNLKFNSSYEKNQFEQHAHVQFSDIMNASDQVEKISTTYHTNDTVTIEAYPKSVT
ncbi:MAG: hypothetical protein GY821_02945 [Gammaproteobacteria bacterium]|nr:hypothetical protein [Gammaproteobacteria bacterium]